MTRFIALLAAALLTACTTTPAPTADASTTLDAGQLDADATTDATADAAPDDQGHDAGPPPCVPAGAWCHYEGTTYGRCLSSQVCGIGPIGTPLECAPISDCHVVDVSQIPECVSLVGPDGVGCDDGDASTFADTCDAGVCAGTECVSDACMLRTWSGSQCVESVRLDEPCDDGDASTYDDRCVASGSCEGIPCECSEGACCDGCHVRPVGTVCDTMRVTSSACTGAASLCGGTMWIIEQYVTVTCDGLTSGCNGAITGPTQSGSRPCGEGNTCIESECRPCP